MTVGKAIYYLLTNATDVTDVVSTRVYPEIAQQDADLPYIVYAIANNEPTDTKPEPSKLDTAQVEVNIYSQSYTECIDLAVAVRAALDRVKGTYNGVNVQSIQYLNEVIDFDEPQRAYNINADYDVRISRSGFEIAQGSPITGVELGELSDVDVSGVTNGQLIAYNSTTGNWEAADDAGGAETLEDLTDVDAGAPSAGQLLSYGQGAWTTIDQDELTLPIGSVTGLQTELNLKAASADFSNVDNTSDADKPVSTATQTALNAKADTSAVPSALNDLSDVTIAGTPTANQALIYDGTSGVFKSLPSFTNRFVDEAENNKQSIVPFAERVYTVKSDGDGIFIDPESDTPTAGKVIRRKIYHKTGFLESGAVIGDFTLIHTFADDTAYSATESTFEGFRDGDTYGTPPFTLIQTWEEVAAVDYLLDDYSGAAAAYSLRLLSSTYSGDAVEVYNGTSYADIGFDGSGELDTTALASHCGSNDGFVSKWYSQTGSNDATQTTTANMPKIYDGATTSVVTENGKPAVEFDGIQDRFEADGIATALSGTDTPLSFFCNVSPNAVANQFVFGVSGSTANFQTSYLRSTGKYQVRKIDDAGGDGGIFRSSQLYTASQFLISGTSAGTSLNVDYDSSTSVLSSVNIDVNASTFTDGKIGSSSTPSAFFNGQMQEIIIYASDQSSNRTDIEDNINTFYSIY